MPDQEGKYDADDDPDAGAATTPDEVEADSERDQAEGDAPDGASEEQGAG